jgi:hypothetical protein
VQRLLTSGPGGWLAGQIPWPAGQVLCQFGPRLHAQMSTREGEGQGDGESRWRQNHIPRRGDTYFDRIPNLLVIP